MKQLFFKVSMEMWGPKVCTPEQFLGDDHEDGVL